MRIRSLALSATILSVAAVALGEVQPAEPAEPASQPAGGAVVNPFQNTYSISGGVAYQFTTDSDPQRNAPPGEVGDFSVTRLGLGITFHHPFGDSHDWLFDHSIVAEHDNYDFDGTFTFTRDLDTGRQVVLTRKPWDNTELLNYSLRATYLVNRDWSVFGGPIVGVAFEDDADIDRALTYGLILGARQQVNQDLAVGLGFVAARGIVGNYTFLPFPIVDWKISEDFAIRSTRPYPGMRGTAGSELVWSFGKFELAGGATYDRREFRLSDDNVASEGVGRNSSFPVHVRFTYLYSDRATISCFAGYLFGGELRLKDRRNTIGGNLDYESAPFIGIGASYRF